VKNLCAACASTILCSIFVFDLEFGHTGLEPAANNPSLRRTPSSCWLARLKCDTRMRGRSIKLKRVQPCGRPCGDLLNGGSTADLEADKVYRRIHACCVAGVLCRSEASFLRPPWSVSRKCCKVLQCVPGDDGLERVSRSISQSMADQTAMQSDQTYASKLPV
jgi:hypothetical protein